MAKKAKYYQRPDGLYEAIRMIKGKRVAFRGKTCREVDRKILEYNETAEKGRKFPAVADEWEVEKAKTVGLSAQSANRTIVKRLKIVFPGYIRDVRPLDVMRHISMMEAQGYAWNTVHHELCTIRMICSYAVLAGDIDVNPAAEVRISRGLPKKTREALTEEQEEIVKANWNKVPFGLFAYFLLYTGLRRGEALALTYADIDRANGVIHITKKLNYASGHRPVLEDWTKTPNGIRDVPLLPPLAAALPKDHIGLIFPSRRTGVYMTATEVKGAWSRYRKAVGLPDEITPHCFRHSFATICYEAGLDIRQAAKICGDTPEVISAVYTHLRDKQQVDAAKKLADYFHGAV